jgi:hypothetical protein
VLCQTLFVNLSDLIAPEIAGNLTLNQEQSRVLKIFSFSAAAGIWASEWNILPYPNEEILGAAKHLFLKWYGGNKTQTPETRCICAIRDYYIKKREAVFRPRYLNGVDHKRYAEVFGFTTTEGKFYLTEEGLEQALGGLPKNKTLKVAFAKGYLLREESDQRNLSGKGIDGYGDRLRVYVFSEKICEFDEEKA